ncbi:hypothetical protein LTR84_000985 [Exophiala bonariae]|uniref:Transcription factor domain-containing protein n=1 Tax=Exophiala bonariae TaxID=1690606 RepID=A0AAV9NTU9_9EURO|nr:hypothetical protein LTR84_000985 [Exophiala bonariae]
MYRDCQPVSRSKSKSSSAGLLFENPGAGLVLDATPSSEDKHAIPIVGGALTHHNFTPLNNCSPLYPAVSFLQSQHCDIEIRSFDHFIHRAAPCYAGAVEDDFWTNTVPRLALYDPVVWDIAVASSYMFEYVPHDPLVASFTTTSVSLPKAKPHQQALKWYNRALSNIRQRMDCEEMDYTYALLTCILCTCIEFQQRNIGVAIHLVHSGYRLLNQSLLTDVSNIKSAQVRALNNVVTSFFSRHALVTANFVVHPLSEWSGPTKNTEGTLLKTDNPLMEKAHSASLKLYRLMYQAYEILRVIVLMWNMPDVIKSQSAGQRVTLDELKRWRISYTERVMNAEDAMMSNDLQLLTSHLLMSWDICYTWFATCIYPTEMAYDQYMDHFAEVVLHADRVLRLRGFKIGRDEPLHRHTKVGLNIVPPLFFTALKCRDPILRRRALALLERAPPAEPWNGVLTPRVAQNAIALEENRPYEKVDLTDPGALAELRARPLPPDGQRLRDIALVGQEQSNAGTTLILELGRIVVDADGTKRSAHETIRVEHPEALTIGAFNHDGRAEIPI